MPDILDPSALLTALPALLPPETSLKTPQDALAALLHTVLTAVSFRLIAVDDSSLATEFADNTLPKEWNAHGPGNYTFRYRHEQSSLEYVLKLTKLAGRTLIVGIATGTERTATVDISTTDYTSESFFPYSFNNGVPLVHGFISSNRVSDLVSTLKLKLISTLMPGLRKEGYEESTQSESSSTRGGELPAAQPRPNRPVAERDPLIYQGPQSHFPPENPLSIGRRDLDPIPMGSNLFAPPPLFHPGRGDGMYVGPDHPMFGGAFGDRYEGRGIRGPWGGDGYLPPMGAPPGARFDPIVPNFGGNPARGPFPRRPNARQQGDPDNDEFMPPGAGDMFM